MQPLSIPRRLNLSAEIVVAVRQRIVDGRLPGGERINEVALSSELGFSRTPLREALAHLEAEGAIYSLPRIGYFVKPLSLEEYTQLYPIRALLDPAALRLAGLPARSRLRELASLNDRMRRASEPEEVLRADDKWHMSLLADCPNRVLLDLIEQLIRRTRRYELALMRDGCNVTISTQEHDLVLTKLRMDDLEGACAALEQNMLTGAGPIIAWLTFRETEG